MLFLLGLVGPGTCMVIIGYIGCDAYFAVAFFTLATALNGAILAGYSGNQLDLAPNFGGNVLEYLILNTKM